MIKTYFYTKDESDRNSMSSSEEEKSANLIMRCLVEEIITLSVMSGRQLNLSELGINSLSPNQQKDVLKKILFKSINEKTINSGEIISVENCINFMKEARKIMGMSGIQNNYLMMEINKVLHSYSKYFISAMGAGDEWVEIASKTCIADKKKWYEYFEKALDGDCNDKIIIEIIKKIAPEKIIYSDRGMGVILLALRNYGRGEIINFLIEEISYSPIKNGSDNHDFDKSYPILNDFVLKNNEFVAAYIEENIFNFLVKNKENDDLKEDLMQISKYIDTAYYGENKQTVCLELKSLLETKVLKMEIQVKNNKKSEVSL